MPGPGLGIGLGFGRFGDGEATDGNAQFMAAGSSGPIFFGDNGDSSSLEFMIPIIYLNGES